MKRTNEDKTFPIEKVSKHPLATRYLIKFVVEKAR
jgi:hypothetical protein